MTEYIRTLIEAKMLPARCLLLWATVVGCTTLPSRSSKAPLPSAPTSATGERQATYAVKAVRLETKTVEGQTSWQIEPAASYTPQTAGIEASTPPHIERRLRYAFDLAQRGATHSANNEFVAVLGLCSLKLDTQEGGREHRTALQVGLTALREADDFMRRHSVMDATADVHRIAAAHRTPLQRQLAKRDLDAVVAVQLYYDFAEERLVYASKGMPSASMALYGLGRTALLMETSESLAAAKAVLLHRTALAVSPSNRMAANELGVLLAQHGKMIEAEEVLRHAVAGGGTSEAWQNLATVYARLGKNDESRRAREQSQTLARKNPGRTRSDVAIESNHVCKEKPKKDFLATINRLASQNNILCK